MKQNEHLVVPHEPTVSFWRTEDWALQGDITGMWGTTWSVRWSFKWRSPHFRCSAKAAAKTRRDCLCHIVFLLDNYMDSEVWDESQKARFFLCPYLSLWQRREKVGVGTMDCASKGDPFLSMFALCCVLKPPWGISKQPRRKGKNFAKIYSTLLYEMLAMKSFR